MKTYTSFLASIAFMKRVMFLTLSIICANNLQAQNPSWSWANGYGGADQDQARKSAVDPWGNIYTTGYFRSTSINFGSFNFANPIAVDVMFLIKTSPSGNIIWAKSVVANDETRGLAVTTDNIGNVFVVGDFSSSSIDFGSHQINNVNPPDWDNFIVKYDSAGNDLWARDIGGPLAELAYSVVCDDYNNVYFGGAYSSDSLHFANDVVYNFTPYDKELLLLKYSSNGSELWMRSSRGPLGSFATAIAIQGNRVYCTGYFEGTFMQVGPDTLWNSSSPNGTAEMYMTMYDTLGNQQWTRSFSGNGHEVPLGIDIDYSGFVCVSGFTSSSNFILNQDTVYNPWLISVPFLARFNNAGDPAWVRYSTLSTTSGTANSVAIGTLGDIIYTGYYIDSISFQNQILTTGCSCVKMFVAAYDNAGNIIWSKDAGGNQNSTIGNGICIGSNSDLYVSGYFESDTAFFDGIQVVNTNPLQQIFLAKIFDPFNSVNNVSTTSIVRVWPNPTNGIATIDIKDMDLKNVTVYNHLGEKVNAKVSGTASQINIDLNSYSSGLYLVQCYCNDKFVTVKILLSKN